MDNQPYSVRANTLFEIGLSGILAQMKWIDLPEEAKEIINNHLQS